MTCTQLETYYRVMMKRIAKHYSAEKLSFLIGRSSDYVKLVEMLEADPYSSDDLKCIATALEEKNDTTFFPLVDDGSLVEVNMQVELAGDKCIYNCAFSKAGQSYQPYFTLQEVCAEGVRLQENNEHDSILANDAIELLIKSGYFYESRMPVKVYHAVNRFLKSSLSPTYIENALNSFCADGVGALQKLQNAKSRFIYREA